MISNFLSDKRVVGVGDCTLDYVFRCHMPSPTQSERILDYKAEGGGITATAIVACSRLGARTELVCRLGCDEVADAIVAGLEREDVCLSRTLKSRQAKSPVSFVHVDSKTGERSIAYYRDNALDDIEPPHLDMDDASCLLIDDTWLDAALQAAKAANKRDVPVIADLLPSNRNEPLLPFVNILIAPSSVMLGHAETDRESVVRMILDKGAGAVIITSGSKGSYYSDGGSTCQVGAFEIEAVDTTGAGDVYHGAFAVATTLGWDIERRMEFASAVSAAKCTKLGGRSGIPSFQEAMQFLRARGRLDWSAFLT